MIANGIVDVMQNWKIIHIPGELPNSQKEEATVNVFASKIDPKFASILVRHLNLRAPLENLGHVKRVRKTSSEGKVEHSIILCLAGNHTSDLERDLPHDIFELTRTYQLQPFIARVPKYPAYSKEEWEAQCKNWPTSFHPNSCKSRSTEELTEEEASIACTFIKAAIENGKIAHKCGQLANGAVIVDPSIREIICCGHDQTGSWKVSRNKSLIKGADWNYQKKPEEIYSAPNCGVEIQSEDMGVEGAEHTRDETKSSDVTRSPDVLATCVGSYLWHPLRHAVMVAIEMAAQRDRELFPDQGSSLDGNWQNCDLLPSIAGISVKRQRTTWGKSTNGMCEMDNPASKDCKVSFEVTDLPRPYLCTGFDVYVTQEPCTMCAMALIHQRVRRVFYAFPNPKSGALGSANRLHGKKSLNHHYDVYHVVVPLEILFG